MWDRRISQRSSVDLIGQCHGYRHVTYDNAYVQYFPTCSLTSRIIGSAEALPILCVRYIWWERERERERERYREREREKDGSDVTIVALKLAMSFALLLAKNVHLSFGDKFCAFPCQKICTSVSPLLIGAEFTLCGCQKRCTFRNGSHSSHCQMAWLTGDRSNKANDRISGCTVLLSRRKNRKNESN